MPIKPATVAVTAALLLAAAPLSAEDRGQLPNWKEVDKTEEGTLTWEKAQDLGIDKQTFQEEDLDDDGELTQYDYKYGVRNRGGKS